MPVQRPNYIINSEQPMDPGPAMRYASRTPTPSPTATATDASWHNALDTALSGASDFLGYLDGDAVLALVVLALTIVLGVLTVRCALLARAWRRERWPTAAVAALHGPQPQRGAVGTAQ